MRPKETFGVLGLASQHGCISNEFIYYLGLLILEYCSLSE